MSLRYKLYGKLAEIYYRHDSLRRAVVLNLYFNALIRNPVIDRYLFDTGWRKERLGQGVVILTNVDGTILRTGEEHSFYTMKESLVWDDWYLPTFSLNGKTVLDIGAGRGETAWFFLKHRAAKVVCVEPDLESFADLETNSRRNRWDVDLINEEFRPEHLLIPHDFVKIDCDGGEGCLLGDSAPDLGPCRMELHPGYIGMENARRLVVKYRLRRISLSSDVWGRDD